MRFVTTNDFGNYIRLERQSQGLTQQQLGNMIKENQRYVSGYESGIIEVNDESNERITSALGYTLKEFKEKYFVYDVIYSNNVPKKHIEQSEDVSNQTPVWISLKDKRDLKKFIESPEGLFFDGIEFSESDRDKLIGMMESMFWEARRQNKEAYKKSREKKKDD